MNKIKIGGQVIADDGEVYHLHINTPIYGNVVAVSEAILKTALKHHRLLNISTMIGNERIEELTSPWGWMGRSKKIKKVFKYENNPMVLYQGAIHNSSSPQLSFPVDDGRQAPKRESSID